MSMTAEHEPRLCGDSWLACANSSTYPIVTRKNKRLRTFQLFSHDSELEGAVVVVEFRVDGDHLRVISRSIVRCLQKQLVAEGTLPAKDVVAQGVSRGQASE